ncbi:competence protein CoiA [Rhodovulum sulfidophilum]|uniref:competence protein CoiA n=1 Tax=Rhodovulum sulfidophilum TaxID=35806 RepID=UPI001924B5DF|nr:competence protein CoiA family protein [Rhodovulum sulfidophilum]MBL3576012.1 hypothetical protein [Rhodovulum sulfidophilum]
MQLALLDGHRTKATKGKTGTCPVCGADVIAKCGNRLVHHWAHASRRDCDPWWENETPWHRAWKELFPETCREIPHVDVSGEIHRSDVRTETGIYIEFQHSAMSDAERHSRENFYQNLIWVVDGLPFKKNFEINHILPSPDDGFAKDLAWFPPGVHGGLFYRRSEHPEAQGDGNSLVLMHQMREIEDQVNASYRGHHQFIWKRPRITWFAAKCPVFLDFGDERLLQLILYDAERPTWCVRQISKRKFLHDVNTEASACSVGTRFYPLPKN